MDNALQALFSWEFLLFSFGCFTIVFLIRTAVEYFIPKTLTSLLWNNLLLVIMSPVIGGLLGLFMKDFAYPDKLTSIGARSLFGLVAGFLSSTIVQIVKGILKAKLQSIETGNLPNTSTPNATPSTNDPSIGNKSP